MIATGDSRPARGRPGWWFEHATRSTSRQTAFVTLAGSVMVRPPFSFQDRRAGWRPGPASSWAHGALVPACQDATRTPPVEAGRWRRGPGTPAPGGSAWRASYRAPISSWPWQKLFFLRVWRGWGGPVKGHPTPIYAGRVDFSRISRKRPVAAQRRHGVIEPSRLALRCPGRWSDGRVSTELGVVREMSADKIMTAVLVAASVVLIPGLEE